MKIVRQHSLAFKFDNEPSASTICDLVDQQSWNYRPVTISNIYYKEDEKMLLVDFIGEEDRNEQQMIEWFRKHKHPEESEEN